MNLEKVVFAFTLILAASVNFGFYLGEIGNPLHHHVYGLYAAIFFNAMAVVLKFGDRSQIGTVLMASSIVAVLQLVMAATIWGYSVHVVETGFNLYERAWISACISAFAGFLMIAGACIDLTHHGEDDEKTS